MDWYIVTFLKRLTVFAPIIGICLLGAAAILLTGLVTRWRVNEKWRKDPDKLNELTRLKLKYREAEIRELEKKLTAEKQQKQDLIDKVHYSLGVANNLSTILGGLNGTKVREKV